MAKFRIGQMVVFGDPQKHGAIAGRLYKVLSTVDLPDCGHCYRITSIAELSGRLVQESALALRPAPSCVVASSLNQNLNHRPRPHGSLH